ncbi:MAG: ABC transporter ATP-binding protein [Eubacteriales bacterium]|nr:ABC transporter ATP-binding protein [Eubacteriales bacterium]
MIDVRHLYKYYGKHAAVSDLSFHIDEGEVLGLLGPNGAGKSTCMNILTGFLSASRGEVTINGHDLLEESQAAKACIGYLPELPPLYQDMTVREYLNFVAELKSIPKAKRQAEISDVMQKVKIDSVGARLIGNLSKGYRQRIGIAQALLGSPPILILDEPTVGLDPQQIIEIRSLIRELAKSHTVIISSHILSEIEASCERVLVIHQGKLIADRRIADLCGGGAELAFELILKRAPRDARQELEKLEGIAQVEALESGESEIQRFRVLAREATEIREALFELCARKNWPIYGLRSLQPSLEEVFIRLTDGELDHAGEVRDSALEQDTGTQSDASESKSLDPVSDLHEGEVESDD